MASRLAGFSLSQRDKGIVKKQRYPYGNGKLPVDVLTIAMGFFIILAIPWGNPAGLPITTFVLALLAAGGAVTYFPKMRQFAKLERSLKSGSSQVILRVDEAGKMQRKAARNALLILIAIIAPFALAYVISPLLWVLILLSTFLSLVISRVAFFLRVRYWERGSAYDLFSYVIHVENSPERPHYEQGILAEQRPRTLGASA